MSEIQTLERQLSHFGEFFYPKDIFERKTSIIGLDTQFRQLKIFLRASAKKQIFREANIPFLPTILLHGPPGLGKTALVRAVCYDEQIPLLEVLPSRIVTSELGKSNQLLEQLFHLIRQYTINNRLVIFFDEIDAIARERDDRNELGEMKRLVITFLTQIIYLAQSNTQSYIIGATNHVQNLDLAVNRRFLLNIEFKYPNEYTIGKIFENIIGRIQSTGKMTVTASFREMKSNLEGATGADIERLFQLALINGLAEGSSKITTKDLKSVIGFVKKTGLKRSKKRRGSRPKQEQKGPYTEDD